MSIRRTSSLSTRLTAEYGVKYPFVGAGMGFVSMPSLVAAVSNAGGIGMLGNAIEPPPGTELLVRMVKSMTPKLFGVNFVVDETPMGPITTDAHIDVCIDEGVQLVVFHFNVPPKAWVDRLRASGARVWAQAPSVQYARDAAAIGVDGIIVQGNEAGGHNKSTTPLSELLPAVSEAVQPIMVLAAGGIADGQSAARALSSGASGVVVGTRLVASDEAYAHAEYKRRIVAASGDSTVITTMFGPEAPNLPYRVLRNRVVNEWAGRESEIPDPPPPPLAIGQTVLFPLTLREPYEMPRFSAIIPTPDTRGDFEEMGMAAGGESARSITEIVPAGQIVREMMHEAERLLLEEARERRRREYQSASSAGDGY